MFVGVHIHHKADDTGEHNRENNRDPNEGLGANHSAQVSLTHKRAAINCGSGVN